MRGIMLDLETMGVQPTAPIVSIGAVYFENGVVVDFFYRTIDITKTIGVIEPQTIKWWLQQDKEAQVDIIKATYSIKEAIYDFTSFYEDHKIEGDNLEVWGNGAGFDNVILRQTYKELNMECPFPFWLDRCYRTIKALNPDVHFSRIGIHHNALNDAQSQAHHLIEIMEKK